MRCKGIFGRKVGSACEAGPAAVAWSTVVRGCEQGGVRQRVGAICELSANNQLFTHSHQPSM